MHILIYRSSKSVKRGDLHAPWRNKKRKERHKQWQFTHTPGPPTLPDHFHIWKFRWGRQHSFYSKFRGDQFRVLFPGVGLVEFSSFPILSTLAYTTGLDYRPTCDFRDRLWNGNGQCVFAAHILSGSEFWALFHGALYWDQYLFWQTVVRSANL